MPHGVIDGLARHHEHIVFQRRVKTRRLSECFEVHRHARFVTGLARHAVKLRADLFLGLARRALPQIPDRAPRFIHRGPHLGPRVIQEFLAIVVIRRAQRRNPFEQRRDSRAPLYDGVVHLTRQAVAFLQHRQETRMHLAQAQPIGSQREYAGERAA